MNINKVAMVALGVGAVLEGVNLYACHEAKVNGSAPSWTVEIQKLNAMTPGLSLGVWILFLEGGYLAYKKFV